MRRPTVLPALSLLLATAQLRAQQVEEIRTRRPFGTLREQAAMQQRWLEQRLTTVLPELMRKHGVDMWVVPMREYNEDPVFSSLVSPTTFAARRRTIYVFTDTCQKLRTANSQLRTPSSELRTRNHARTVSRGGELEVRGSQFEVRSPQPAVRSPQCGIQRLALGGSSQGGVYEAMRSVKAAAGPAGAQAQRQAELWGDEQWQLLKRVVEERNPRVIGIDVSRVFAFSDGLSAGELEGMREALGAKWTARFKRAEALPLDLIATRLPEEDALYRQMMELVWQIIDTAFSNAVITPGVTRTEDVVWWMRQKVNDLGLGTWFQPSVEVQRKGWNDVRLGDNPVIEKGDVLHCDFGITALRLNTDTQHMGYVLLDGETDAPTGLKRLLANSNQLQDIVMRELRAGRTGNEILRASLARMRAAGIDGTVYSHPIGMHGHGAGPLIGLWDYQDGVPGRGDAKAIPNMWFSIELQATTPVAEWNGQRVRSAQEEDAFLGSDGIARCVTRRQTDYHLVRPK